jgi:Flp pilus assembly protein TadG
VKKAKGLINGRTTLSHGGERGQVLVVFALALFVILAGVGLVLDGGSTFAQRRGEQNAADLAALAAANDYLVNHSTTSATATALRVAREDGYTNGARGVSVTTSYDMSAGARGTVDITAPHQNSFAGIVGMSSWNVGVTATALTGFPDTATGPAPFILSRTAFGVDGTPLHCTGPNDPCALQHPVGDTPKAYNDFVWTNFGYNKMCHDTGNVNDHDLSTYLAGSATFTITLQFGCYIAQHNDGVMMNIVTALGNMAPVSFPVPVVDTSGNFTGWVMFELTSASGTGRNAELNGYFLQPFQAQRLTVVSPGLGNTNFGGSYVLKLVN